MNREMLEKEMKAKKIKKGEMCRLLGMSRSAFYRKSRGCVEFTRLEIQRIIEILELDNPMEIFFDDRVS